MDTIDKIKALEETEKLFQQYQFNIKRYTVKIHQDRSYPKFYAIKDTIQGDYGEYMDSIFDTNWGDEWGEWLEVTSDELYTKYIQDQAYNIEFELS